MKLLLQKAAQRVIRRAGAALVMLSLGAVLSGCESVPDEPFTERAWEANMGNVYRPDAQSPPQFFQRHGQNDVLVRYNEEREKTGSVHPRAYFVIENDRGPPRAKDRASCHPAWPTPCNRSRPIAPRPPT